MSPICPRCGDILEEAWRHTSAKGFLACELYEIVQRFRSIPNIPPTDGRESGHSTGELTGLQPVGPAADDGRESMVGAVKTSNSPSTAAANSVRRFFAGSCRRCGDHVYVPFEPTQAQFDHLLCGVCYDDA